MSNAVANNLPSRRLSPQNGVLSGIPVYKDIQFRNLGNPAAINFQVQLNCELHSHSLTPAAGLRQTHFAGPAIQNRFVN